MLQNDDFLEGTFAGLRWVFWYGRKSFWLRLYDDYCGYAAWNVVMAGMAG